MLEILKKLIFFIENNEPRYNYVIFFHSGFNLFSFTKNLKSAALLFHWNFPHFFLEDKLKPIKNILNWRLKTVYDIWLTVYFRLSSTRQCKIRNKTAQVRYERLIWIYYIITTPHPSMEGWPRDGLKSWSGRGWHLGWHLEYKHK